MKLTTLQENLAKGLSTVSRLVTNRAQLPALNNILLSTDKGRLKLSATNLETGINFWLGAKIEKQGALSIPAKILTEFISSLPAGRINLQVKKNSLFLKSDSYQANFVGLPASEFPVVPTLKNKKAVLFESSQLAKTVNQVAFAAAQDESRPVLTAVLLLTAEKTLTWAATDGYRLSLKKMKKFEKKGKTDVLKKGLLIPARTLMEVAKIISEQKEAKQVGLAVMPDSNQAIFSTRNAEVISRLIEGQFPEFEKIIPEKKTTKVIIDLEELVKAVRVASIFARESANIIKLEIEKNKVKISANTPQIGDNLIEIDAQTEGEKNKIAFNFRYLLDFFNSVKAKEVSLEMSSPLNPGVFRLAKDASLLHLIMPVRVQE